MVKKRAIAYQGRHAENRRDGNRGAVAAYQKFTLGKKKYVCQFSFAREIIVSVNAFQDREYFMDIIISSAKNGASKLNDSFEHGAVRLGHGIAHISFFPEIQRHEPFTIKLRMLF